MLCSDEKCENDNAFPFVLFKKKNLSAERRAFCPKHLQKFRRAHATEIGSGELVMNMHYSTPDYRFTMQEFSGEPARRRRL
jgi:hypothetical protein